MQLPNLEQRTGTQIAIRLPLDLATRLDQAAEGANASRSALVRALLRANLPELASR